MSVEIGEALFAVIGIERSTEPAEDEPTGGVFANRVVADLVRQVDGRSSGLAVIPEQRLNGFEQYRQGTSSAFDRAWTRLSEYVRRQASGSNAQRLEALIAAVEAESELRATRLSALLDELGDESLLGLDVTVARDSNEGSTGPGGRSLTQVVITHGSRTGLSLAGAKMSALRRGRMPHFAAMTMEPRPYMLNLLGGGSGDVDCVYHLDLPSLVQAVEDVYVGSPQRLKGRDTFRRLVDQGRLRDYDELVEYVASI